jgi:hypothetical protein
MLKDFLKIAALSLIAMSLVGVAYAWTEPSQSPPNSNVSSPVTVGAISQYKSGAIGVGGVLWGNSNAIFDGNVGIGTSSPGYKLDVAGQIKSNSGGFVFPDGTTQTTAATTATKSPAIYQCPNWECRCSGQLTTSSTCTDCGLIDINCSFLGYLVQ